MKWSLYKIYLYGQDETAAAWQGDLRLSPEVETLRAHGQGEAAGRADQEEAGRATEGSLIYTSGGYNSYLETNHNFGEVTNQILGEKANQNLGEIWTEYLPVIGSVDLFLGLTMDQYL